MFELAIVTICWWVMDCKKLNERLPDYRKHLRNRDGLPPLLSVAFDDGSDSPK
jgi:hypothetical protein